MPDFCRPPVSPEHAGCARWCGAVLALLLVLGGCDQTPSRTTGGVEPAPPPGQPALADSSASEKNSVKLAYSHDVALEMPSSSIAPRFMRARDLCISNAQIGCIVLNASLNMGDSAANILPGASLTVRLPHNSVAPFEQSLLVPLPDEKPGDAILRSQVTTADDLTRAIADLEQRQAQLTDYRDRLRALTSRADAKVEDLIKIESELSTVQSELESIAAQKKRLDERVATESVAVDFRSRASLGGFVGPVSLAWRQAGEVLGESAGNAIRFSIFVLPWLPVGAIGLILLRLIVRRWRR